MPEYRLSRKAYEKLVRYADLLHTPLLIAWKLYGHWTLFNIREMKQRQSAYYIDWDAAMRNDLMYLLLGNVWVTPKSGTSLTFFLQDLGPTERYGLDEGRRVLAYRGIQFLDASGAPISNLSWPQFVLWTLFTEHEEKQDKQEDVYRITFQIPTEPVSLPAYWFLRLMVSAWRSREKQPRNWYNLIKEDQVGPITYSQLRQAMDDGLGTLVNLIGQHVPHDYPDFLPPDKVHPDIWE
jgi:hypothetical protein